MVANEDEPYKAVSNKVKKRLGQQLMGSADLPVGSNAYVAHSELIRRLQGDPPDVLLVIMDPFDRDYFFSQFEYANIPAAITEFPFLMAQTRESYTRVLQAAPKTGAGYRVSSWEATISEPRGKRLNEEYLSRSGMLMDAFSWASYAAVAMAYQTFSSLASVSAKRAAAYIHNPQTRFEVQKKHPVFVAESHTLQQSVCALKLNTTDNFQTDVRNQRGLARYLEQLR